MAHRWRIGNGTARLLAATICLLICGLASTARGQVWQPDSKAVRLPSLLDVQPEGGSSTMLLGTGPGGVPMNSSAPPHTLPVGYPSELTDELAPQGSPASTPPRPSATKPGAFQQIVVTETWLPRGNSNLGLSDFGAQATFAFPMPTPESPLVLTPAFDVTYVDGPTVPDLPPELYDASLQIRHLRKLTPQFGIDLAVTPGWHGDFAANSGRSFRLPSRALGAYDWTPNAQIIFGVVYLDREDINWLPAGGLIWTPDDDTRWEIIVPRPRFARRYFNDGLLEYWWYLAGEFGGGSYGIERANGTPDVATLSDLRFIFGLERKKLGGLNGRLEVGYVFDRSIQYLSGTPEFKPDPTMMLRGGISY